MLELWEGGQHFRKSSLIYPSWFLGIFPRLLALFQMLSTGGSCRTHEGGPACRAGCLEAAGCQR